MNLPFIRSRARRGAKASARGMWEAALRYWNVVRPAWPVPAFAIFTWILLWGSSQGKEALYAVSDPREATFFVTLVVLFLASIAQYGVFLRAVCGYYPSFSDRASQSTRVRLWGAAATGMINPSMMLLFNLLERERETLPFGESLAAVWRDISNSDAYPMTIASFAVWLILFVLSFQATKQWVRLHVSPFSAIARMSGGSFRFIVALFAFGAVVALATQFLPGLARSLGPVGLTLLGMTLWSAAWTYAVVRVERCGWPPTPALAIGLMVLVSIVGPLVDYGLRTAGLDRADIVSFDRNRVDLIRRTNSEAPVDIAQHASQWLDERDDTGRARAIIVLAEGGGIRAAVQTAAVLGALSAEDDNFFRDLYVVSGVSGGSVGIASYLAAKAERRGNIEEAAVAPLRADHLSPVLGTMYFWDWPFAFFPIPTAGAHILDYDLHDRGSTFEASLQQAQSRLPDAAQRRPCAAGSAMIFRQWQNNAMACPFLDVVRAAANGSTAPIVLFNTTRTLDGDNEVVSNVTFGHHDRMCNVLRRTPADRTLSLATAAHLSARFPFISPPGTMRANRLCRSIEGDVLRYVDGGYLDNSGALTASEAVSALESVRGAVAIDYVVIHIYTPVITTGQSRNSDTLPELSAPLDAVTRARSLQGLGPVINLCRQIAGLGTLQADERLCDPLGRRRTLTRAEAGVALGENFNATYVLQGVAGEGQGPRAYWITAPLPVSGAGDVNAENFVPLGWVLGKRSVGYIVGSSRELVQERIAPLLNRPSDAPSAPAATP